MNYGNNGRIYMHPNGMRVSFALSSITQVLSATRALLLNNRLQYDKRET